MRRHVVALLLIAACGDDDGGPVATQLSLEMPGIIGLPYVVAGAGETSAAVSVTNLLDADSVGLSWTVVGDPTLTVRGAPDGIGAGETVVVRVAWTGSDTPRITGGELVVMNAVGSQQAEVWAVAGDPALAPAVFEPVSPTGAGVPLDRVGVSAVVHLPSAPFPDGAAAWTDDRVHLFVPADYRERDAHDLVLHFHGHNTTIDDTVPAHRYREQVFASGANAILIVPQGPVNAASGDFGKLADPEGTQALLDEVLTVLYRAGRIQRPVLGDVMLTSHSGGYLAVAQNLAPASFHVHQVSLFDSLYGFVETYLAFALDLGRLRSNFTDSGGTDANNRALIASLEGQGIGVGTDPLQRFLREDEPVIYATGGTHHGATRDDAAYAEQLRWGAPASRRGARVELRSATLDAGTVTVTWLAPRDADVTGYSVQTSPNGTAWTQVAETGPDATSATFAQGGTTRVRIVPVLEAVAPTARQPSDTYLVGPGADLLVVDGFDRAVDGSWSGLAHDFAARVGLAAGAPVHTVSNEAITEDAFDLTPYRTVIWLTGDESAADRSLGPDERVILGAYLQGGGHVVLSGSEIGYDLDATTGGATWLADATGATLAADDAGSNAAAGEGPLAAVASFPFGGTAAPYPEDFADTFTAGAGATVVLRYGSGGAAAVGIAGRAVIVGFPLEVVESPATLAALVPALVGFVN